MRRTREVDMSPEAIDRRLREVGQLYRLGMSIRDAKLLGRTEELRRADGPNKPQPAAEAARSRPSG